MTRLDREPQPPLPGPYEHILLAFYYFQKDPNQEIKMDEEGLVNVCLAANCPNEETAKKILMNMVREGLLTRGRDKKTRRYFYTRTQLGTQKTPPPPPGPIPRTAKNN